MIYLGILMLIASCVVGGSTNTVLPAIAEQTGWDVGFLRSMAGIGVMFCMLGNLVFGSVVKKKGAKFANGLTMILFAVVMVIYGFTRSLPIFIACIMVLGFLSGCFNGTGNHAQTANWWPTKKGAVLGFTTIGIVLMDLVWQPFAPRWFASIGIGWTMTIFAVIVVLIALWGIFGTKNTPEEAGEYPDGIANPSEDMIAQIKAMKEYVSPYTFKKVLSTPAVWTIGIGMALMRAVNLGYAASIVPRLLQCGYDYQFAVVVLMVGGVAGVIGSALIGLLDQKLGTKKAILIYAIVFLIAIIISLFHANGPVFVWISAIILLAVCGGTANLIPSAFITKFGRWDYPAVGRVGMAMGELGAGVGIMATGLFANYQTMYIVFIVAIIVGAAMVMLTKFNLIGKAD